VADSVIPRLPIVGDGARDFLSFRGRAYGDLPGAAGSRVGGRSELGRAIGSTNSVKGEARMNGRDFR